MHLFRKMHELKRPSRLVDISGFSVLSSLALPDCKVFVRVINRDSFRSWLKTILNENDFKCLFYFNENLIKMCFLNGPSPAIFLIYFRLFKQTLQYIQQINV